MTTWVQPCGPGTLLTLLLWLHSATSSDPSVPVRLADGPHKCSGRVEVNYNNEWGTVCDDFWGMRDAQVVCKQLQSMGCGRAVSASTHAAFGPGYGPIWLDNVHCNGDEMNLIDCPNAVLGRHNCGHNEDAGVTCEYSETTLPPSPSPSTSPPVVHPVEVRLVGGPHQCAGRVEVFHNYEWGTVCGEFWDVRDAQVVCGQLAHLGCGSAVSAATTAAFGPGSGPIWLANVHCTGTEDNLIYCQSRGIGQHNCGHYEDAGVICQYSAPTPSTTSEPETTTPEPDCDDTIVPDPDYYDKHGPDYYDKHAPDYYDKHAPEYYDKNNPDQEYPKRHGPEQGYYKKVVVDPDFYENAGRDPKYYKKMGRKQPYPAKPVEVNVHVNVDSDDDDGSYFSGAERGLPVVLMLSLLQLCLCALLF